MSTPEHNLAPIAIDQELREVIATALRQEMGIPVGKHDAMHVLCLPLFAVAIDRVQEHHRTGAERHNLSWLGLVSPTGAVAPSLGMDKARAFVAGMTAAEQWLWNQLVLDTRDQQIPITASKEHHSLVRGTTSCPFAAHSIEWDVCMVLFAAPERTPVSLLTIYRTVEARPHLRRLTRNQEQHVRDALRRINAKVKRVFGFERYFVVRDGQVGWNPSLEFPSS